MSEQKTEVPPLDIVGAAWGPEQIAGRWCGIVLDIAGPIPLVWRPRARDWCSARSIEKCEAKPEAILAAWALAERARAERAEAERDAAVLAEREVCAKVAGALGADVLNHVHEKSAYAIAAAIRARGGAAPPKPDACPKCGCGVWIETSPEVCQRCGALRGGA